MAKPIAVEATHKEDLETLEAMVKKDKADRLNFNAMTDAQLMDAMFERSIEIPTDDGKVVRKVAIQKLIAWEDAAKPLNEYRKCRVIFSRSGKEGEASYVFLSLNGVAYQVPFDTEVILPEPVIKGCVDLAVQTSMTLTEDTDVNGSMHYNEKQIRTLPYTMLGYVD